MTDHFLRNAPQYSWCRTAGHGRRRAHALLVSLLMMFLAGCSDNSRPAGDNSQVEPDRVELTDVCGVLAGVNTSAAQATNADEGLELLRELEPEIATVLDDAPDSIKADAATIAKAIRAAVTEGSLKPLATRKTLNAGTRLAEQCNLEPETPAPTD